MARKAKDPRVIAEAEVRGAGSLFLAGSADSALGLLRGIVARYPDTDVAARAQFLVGDLARRPGPVRGSDRRDEPGAEAVLPALGGRERAVPRGPLPRRARPEGRRDRHLPGGRVGLSRSSRKLPRPPTSPGVGLLSQGKPRLAAPYFQIVLDRYTTESGKPNSDMFRSPERQELVDASLCLLLYSYHQAGDLGQLAGAPHVLLEKMPPSRSPWRAYALLIDADASAAQARYPEAQATLERLMHDFPDQPDRGAARRSSSRGPTRGRGVTVSRSRPRSAWSRDTAEAASRRSWRRLSSTSRTTASTRRTIAPRPPGTRRSSSASRRTRSATSPTTRRASAYVRLSRAGDAVDHWEAIVKDSAGAPIAERAWARAGRPLLPGAALRRGQALLPGPARELRRRRKPRALAMLRLGAVRVQRRQRRGGAPALFRGHRAVSRFARTPARPSAGASSRSTGWGRARGERRS